MLPLGSLRVLVAALSAACGVPVLSAEPRVSQEPRKPDDRIEYSGISLFRTYCATCHGVEARGDGPMADQLHYRPPDLTLLAQRNNGAFPSADVLRTIDGRNPLRGHGGPDMPVWGDAFKNSREGFDDDSVRAKIQAIVDYLAGIQQRSKTK